MPTLQINTLRAIDECLVPSWQKAPTPLADFLGKIYYLAKSKKSDADYYDELAKLADDKEQLAKLDTWLDSHPQALIPLIQINQAIAIHEEKNKIPHTKRLDFLNALTQVDFELNDKRQAKGRHKTCSPGLQLRRNLGRAIGSALAEFFEQYPHHEKMSNTVHYTLLHSLQQFIASVEKEKANHMKLYCTFNKLLQEKLSDKAKLSEWYGQNPRAPKHFLGLLRVLEHTEKGFGAKNNNEKASQQLAIFLPKEHYGASPLGKRAFPATEDKKDNTLPPRPSWHRSV